MAAPQFVPTDPLERPRSYEWSARVPGPWTADRPADLDGRQPSGPHLGSPGPDQGYALLLASRLRPRVLVAPGESVDDALTGCLGIALRRASLFGRAPVIHDFTIALTMWGFFDADPPTDLLVERRTAFEGLAHTAQHYAEARSLVDRVPEATLRMLHGQVQSDYPARWRAMVGCE